MSAVAFAQKASISGTFLDAAGKPLPETQVYALAKGQAVRATADKEGRYTLPNLEPGSYVVRGVVSSRFVSSMVYRSVTVHAGQELTGIDFKVQPPPEISGRVLDENKEPMQGVQVFLVVREYDSGTLRYVFTNSAVTDDQGEYRLQRVVPGRAYLVMARKYESTLPAISPEPADPKLRRRAFASTYYPESIDLEGASPLVLREGEKRDGVDIRLAGAPSLCLEGTAETATGPSAMRFEIMPARPASGFVGDSGFYIGAPGALTGPDGKFRVCGLAPGDYKLTAADSSQANPFYGQLRLTVRNADISRARIPASPSVSISGETVWDGDAPKTPLKDQVLILLRHFERTSFMGEKNFVTVSVPQTFNFPSLLMDEYSVDVRSVPPQYYVKDIFYGAQSVQYGTMHAGSAMGNAALRIVIGADGARVQVKCADKDNNPIPDANIVLLPADATTEAALAARMTTGQADQNGNYSSPAVRPGKYHVIATTSPVMKSPECMRALMDQRMNAKELSLGPGGNVQITLNPVN